MRAARAAFMVEQVVEALDRAGAIEETAAATARQLQRHVREQSNARLTVREVEAVLAGLMALGAVGYVSDRAGRRYWTLDDER